MLVGVRGAPADCDPLAADPSVGIAVDNGDLHGLRADVGNGIDVTDGAYLRDGPGDRLVPRPTADDEQPGSAEEQRELPHASPGTASTCTGCSDQSRSSRINSEKKPVITTPARKSPRRGSSRSPAASASASSG